MAISNVDLVGDIRPVVTPSATAAMSEAVRNGTISILDVMDRVDERTKKKQELELITAQQGIANAQDPQLIQAARNQKLAEGATAQNVIASAPLAQQAKTAELKAAIFDAQSKPGGYDLMQTALSKAGFPVAVDPNAGLTEANKAEILKRFTSLAEYTQKKTEASDRVKNIESKFFPTEQTTAAGTTKGQLQKLFHNGQEISSEQLKTWAQEAKTLERTPFSSYYLLKPGQAAAAPVTAAPAPSAVPVVQSAATAPVAAPVVQPAAAPTPNMVQPAAAPTPNMVQPAAVQVGQTVPGLGFVTSIAPPPFIPGQEKQTDKLQRELINLDASKSKIAQARQLIAGENVIGPKEIGMVQKAHQFFSIFNKNQERIYTSQDQLNNVIADEIADYVQSWKGAISEKELQFFKEGRPRISSTPETWKNYLNRWELKNEEIRKIVKGELAPADPAAWAANPKSQVAAAGTPGSLPPAPALSAAPSAAPMLRTFVEAEQQPSGKVFRDANGKLRRRL